MLDRFSRPVGLFDAAGLSLLVAGGHDVTVRDRDLEEAGRLAEELRGAAEEGATVESAGPDAELRGEVVILAVYYPGSLELAGELGDRLAGKVVVDISNPLNETLRARHLTRYLCGGGGGGDRTGRCEGGQGLQHHLLRYAG
jgi:predicted dinucleotide-binding enzyme